MDYQFQADGDGSSEMESFYDSQIVLQNLDSNKTQMQEAELDGELLDHIFSQWCEGELPEKSIKKLVTLINDTPRFGPMWVALVIAGVFGIIFFIGTFGNIASAAVTVWIL